MAQVYSGVDSIFCPDFQWEELEKYNSDMDAYKESLRNFCKEQTKCPHAGEIISFPIADGSAQYMVMSYTKLIHINEGDGYSIPEAHARRLRKADIIQCIKQKKAMDKLFNSSANAF